MRWMRIWRCRGDKMSYPIITERNATILQLRIGNI